MEFFNVRIRRKLRGIMGTAFLSSLAWAPLGALWALVVWILTQREFRTQDIPFPPVTAIVLMCAVWGFIAGAIFATILAVFESRRTNIDSISRLRVVVFGAIAGATLPVALPQLLTLSFIPPMAIMAASAIYGVGISVGMLELARANFTRLIAASSISSGSDSN